MATLQVSRVPLGGIDESRLRSLVNKKNVQNAFAHTSTNMKRRRDIDSDPAQDPENMDPTLFSPKKAKTGPASFDKPQHFIVKATSSSISPTSSVRPLLTPNRFLNKTEKISPVSFSAPAGAPAGRSPTRSTRRAGILRKKRSYTRVDPPKFALENNGPWTLDAALSGSLGNKARSVRINKQKDACSLDDSASSGWFFSIHEDSPDDHASNMIQHSTSILDISDEEEKRHRELDERGKENIPPIDYIGPGSNQRDAMTDDVRLPLGMLDASDFYGAGVDANSFVVIEDDNDAKKSTIVSASTKALEVPADHSPTEAMSTGLDAFNEIVSRIEQPPVDLDASSQSIGVQVSGDPQLEVQSSQEPPVDIWESESAQGDDGEIPEAITITAPLQHSIAAIEVLEVAALDAHINSTSASCS